MMMNFNFLLNVVVVVIFIIFSIAFYTLMERKILSYQQNRKGPNKISLGGIIQPASDAVKLLNKKEFKLMFSNNLLYWMPPFYSFFMLILVIQLIPCCTNIVELKVSSLIFFCLIAMTSFSIIIMGWSSNSKYTFLGSLRALAQSISYEILIFLCMTVFFIVLNTFEFSKMLKEKEFINNLLWIVLMMSMLSLVCEVNRAPFDLSEGESELVSGFNTEYGMTKFSLIFLSEYGMMMFMSFVMAILMNFFMWFIFFIKIVMLMFSILWLRSSYPRLRYDMLMYLTWKNLVSYLMLVSIMLYLIL